MGHAMLDIAEKIKIQEKLILDKKMELIQLKRDVELWEVDMIRDVNGEVDKDGKLVNTNDTKRQIALSEIKNRNSEYKDFIIEIENKKYNIDIDQIELNFLKNSFEFYKIQTSLGNADFVKKSDLPKVNPKKVKKI